MKTPQRRPEKTLTAFFIKNALPEPFMYLHLRLIPGEHKIYMGTGPTGLVTSSYSEKDGGSDEDKKICIMCRDH